MSCPSTSQRPHRRTSIRIPTPRYPHRHPSPPPSHKQARMTQRSAWSKHIRPDPEAGHYTLGAAFDHRSREIRSEIWQCDRETGVHCPQRMHENTPRRPRACTIASTQELGVRPGRSRLRSASLASSSLNNAQPPQICPAILAATRADLPPAQRKRDPRRNHPMHHRPGAFVPRDPGYESDDADIDTSNEENAIDEQKRPTGLAHMSKSYGLSNIPQRAAAFGHIFTGLDAHASLLRPGSPSNDSSASTDDDNVPATVDPHAMEHYLGDNDTWRTTEIFSESSEECGLSDDEEEIARPLDDPLFPDGSLTGYRSGTRPHRPRRSHRAPPMPKRIPLVPTCSKSRKRASMRAAWKMRFGRLFESDSEATTEVDDELDWEGYESADARRIVAMRILKAGGGDGRKIMHGKDHLSELLVKRPIDPRRLAARIPRRSRADTIRARERVDMTASIQSDTCTTCAATLSPSLSTKSVTASATDSPTLTNSTSLVTPVSTPPSSVPNTPCPVCVQLSPRGDALELPMSPHIRRKALSPRSPPCKTTPLHAGTDPLTVFAVAVEQEKQRDFSGLLKRSIPPPESTFSSVSNGLLRGVRSFLIKLNNFVDFAANAPLPTGVDGTCPLSPVMPSCCITREITGTRRRAASAPEVSPAPHSRSQRRKSYVRAPTQVVQSGAPTSPYGYRVRPQQVSAAFPALDERMGNVAPTPVPTIDGLPPTPSSLELKAVLRRPAEDDSPHTSSDQMPIAPIGLKGPPENHAEVRRRRASRSPSRRRGSSTKRSSSGKPVEPEKILNADALNTKRDEALRTPRAVVDSKYWRVLAGEMEQRRRGGVEVAFMVRLAVEEGRNLPIFTSEEQQAATGEIVVGGVWKASLARWRIGGVGKGPMRIRSSLVNEVSHDADASDTLSDSSSGL